jgi:hypothetical protein
VKCKGKTRNDLWDRNLLSIALSSALWDREGVAHLAGTLDETSRRIWGIVEDSLGELADDVRMSQGERDVWLAEVLPQAAAKLGVSMRVPPTYRDRQPLDPRVSGVR